MANKPLQSIKFPNLPDTYTVPVVDSTLAVSGAAADAKKTGDELAKKVNAVSGKGLSANDFTTTEKNKLSGIESGANKTVIDSTLAVSGNAADAKAVGDALAVVDRNAYGAYIIPTASGPIAHFTDGADNIPMKDVLVHIEPVQEGSGDPSPTNVRAISGWTGAKVTRCGKNLCPRLTGRTINGITFTSNADGSLTVSGTATSEALNASAATASVLAGYPVLAKGTYYLSGGNGARLYAQVKNRDASVATVTISGNQLNNFSIIGTQPAMFTVTKPCCIYVRADILSGDTINATAYPMIRLASDTDDTYEPYHADTYDITFPSEAGTVYGGTLDVTTGTLTVTHKLYTFDGSENWVAGNYSSRYEFYSTIPDGTNFRTWVDGGRGLSNIGIYDGTSHNTESAKDYIASRTTLASSATGNRQHVLVVPPSIATTAEELKAFLANTPEQWYAPLQTPQTYQLTLQEITSLLGENNLWADTGDSEVEYRADTKMYVDAKVAAAVSALS